MEEAGAERVISTVERKSVESYQIPNGEERTRGVVVEAAKKMGILRQLV